MNRINGIIEYFEQSIFLFLFVFVALQLHLVLVFQLPELFLTSVDLGLELCFFAYDFVLLFDVLIQFLDLNLQSFIWLQ